MIPLSLRSHGSSVALPEGWFAAYRTTDPRHPDVSAQTILGGDFGGKLCRLYDHYVKEVFVMQVPVQSMKRKSIFLFHTQQSALVGPSLRNCWREKVEKEKRGSWKPGSTKRTI